jgi:hypothetical protein
LAGRWLLGELRSEQTDNDANNGEGITNYNQDFHTIIDYLWFFSVDLEAERSTGFFIKGSRFHSKRKQSDNNSNNGGCNIHTIIDAPFLFSIDSGGACGRIQQSLSEKACLLRRREPHQSLGTKRAKFRREKHCNRREMLCLL